MKLITIAVPCNWAYVPTAFFASCVQMFSRTQEKYNIALLVSNSSLIDTMRERLVDESLKMGADYIMWLDADQIYPADTILKLAEHCENGKLVVGGVTPHKNDGNPMVWTFGNNYGAGNRDRGFKTGRGLVKVDSMGFGGIMTAKEVFDSVHYPRFVRTWDKDMNNPVGEDFCFYARCKDKGVDVWCDTDLIFQHMVMYAVSLYDKAFIDVSSGLGLPKM
jgi:hypothetical protein